MEKPVVVPLMLEGSWLIEYGPGRQQIVHSQAKVNIALRCGYKVSKILPTETDCAPLSKDQIREVFLANGFTIKEGQKDLKAYVYQAAEALLALAAK